MGSYFSFSIDLANKNNVGGGVYQGGETNVPAAGVSTPSYYSNSVNGFEGFQYTNGNAAGARVMSNSTRGGFANEWQCARTTGSECGFKAWVIDTALGEASVFGVGLIPRSTKWVRGLVNHLEPMEGVLPKVPTGLEEIPFGSIKLTYKSAIIVGVPTVAAIANWFYQGFTSGADAVNQGP